MAKAKAPPDLEAQSEEAEEKARVALQVAEATAEAAQRASALAKSAPEKCPGCGKPPVVLGKAGELDNPLRCGTCNRIF